MNKWNFMLSWVEHEKSFITLGPDCEHVPKYYLTSQFKYVFFLSFLFYFIFVAGHDTSKHWGSPGVSNFNGRRLDSEQIWSYGSSQVARWDQSSCDQIEEFRWDSVPESQPFHVVSWSNGTQRQSQIHAHDKMSQRYCILTFSKYTGIFLTLPALICKVWRMKRGHFKSP